ncbi:MAG: adenylate/guanylate cyclase domain-containing protein [Polyangia bacterium]
MGTLFLQEAEATIILADIRDFSALAQSRGATVELAITLSRFYEHVAAAIKQEGGRVIKLVGDGVLGAFIGTADHRRRGIRALHALVGSVDAMNAPAKAADMPVVDYTVVLGTGRVLAGDLGADKLQGFDVIGATVNRIFRLSNVATKRGASNLVEASTFDQLSIEDRPPARAVAAEVIDGESITLFAVDVHA